MKLGLFGYGKMGRAIEQAARARGLDVAWTLTRDNRRDATPDFLRTADVAIEFTRPDAAFDNVRLCLEAGVPCVSGTTGWSERLPEAKRICAEKGGALLWASNFSVGVNLFFAVNRYLAQLMDSRPEYDVAVSETHHVHKLDAPSGTALTLANDLIAALARKAGWALHPEGNAPTDIVVTAHREDEVPGTHVVNWSSAVDEITLEHRAHSRAGFAEGAVLAAQWLHGKKGVYSMNDVLGL
jgi:4-hydroxy-tetrahydrodipicolinate reductase